VARKASLVGRSGKRPTSGASAPRHVRSRAMHRRHHRRRHRHRHRCRHHRRRHDRPHPMISAMTATAIIGLHGGEGGAASGREHGGAARKKLEFLGSFDLLGNRRPCGLMDKALVLGTKDCRFESCQGHNSFVALHIEPTLPWCFMRHMTVAPTPPAPAPPRAFSAAIGRTTPSREGRSGGSGGDPCELRRILMAAVFRVWVGFVFAV
jgi:hypothetical protein